jgi:hypothetical protein
MLIHLTEWRDNRKHEPIWINPDRILYIERHESDQ